MVHSTDISSQLTDESRLEFACFQFDDNITTQFKMIKKKIGKQCFIAHFERNLTAYISKTLTEFYQKSRDIPRQGIFKFPLFVMICECDEIECIWVFQCLLG